MKRQLLLAAMTSVLAVSVNAQVFLGFGDTGYDIAADVATNHSGRTAVTGIFQGQIQVDPRRSDAILNSVALADVYVAVYDVQGRLEWVRRIGPNSFSSASTNVEAVHVDEAGSVYLAGALNGPVDFSGNGTLIRGTKGQYDAWIARFDPAGNIMWATTIGGTAEDRALDVSVDSFGFVYAGGFFTGTADFASTGGPHPITSYGTRDGFFVRYDPSGNLISAVQFGGTGSDSVASVAVDPVDLIWIGGQFQSTARIDAGSQAHTVSSAGASDLFFGRYSTGGEMIYGWSFGGPQAETMPPGGVATNSATAVFIGNFSGTAGVTGTGSVTSAGRDDIAMILLRQGGRVVSHVKRIGGPETDRAEGVTFDGTGVYVTGSFEQSIDVNPAAAETKLTAGPVVRDGFLAKYGAELELHWATSFGSVVEHEIPTSGLGVAPHPDGVIVAGFFGGVIEFGRPGVPRIFETAGGPDAFAMTYGRFGGLASPPRRRAVQR